MRVDPQLPRAEKPVLVLETIGDNKVRIDSTSLYNPLVALANEASEVVAIEKQLYACRAPRHAGYLNIVPTGFSGADYGPSMTPLAVHAYCSGHLTGVHIRSNYVHFRTAYSQRIKALQHRYQESTTVAGEAASLFQTA
jgi:hypothetical protein